MIPVNQSLCSLIGPLYLIGVWYSEDQRTNTKTYVVKILDYIHPNFFDHSTLNDEHGWDDLCNQLKKATNMQFL
jgi:hypothetical protein